MHKDKPTIEDIKEEIKGTWFWYKVCEGCEKPVLYEVVSCPGCRGYRFDENRKRVIKTTVARYEEKFKRGTDSQQSEHNDLNVD
jgi:hypothetical protein